MAVRTDLELRDLYFTTSGLWPDNTTGDIDASEDVVFDYPDEEDYEKLPTDFVLYVRAFSDKDLTKWNQDSISLFDDLPDQIRTESEDENNTPGFEVISLIAALGVSVILFKKKSLSKK